MKVKVRYFSIDVSDKGLSIVDNRHKPPMKCGKLSWKQVMDLIEDVYEPPAIISGT